MIIGISGLAGSGKDTAAEYLIKNHSFVRIGMADAMKRFAQEVFAFNYAQMWGPSSARNAPDKRYPRDHTYSEFFGEDDTACLCCGWDSGVGSLKVPQCYLTPRYALQELGTAWGRGCYNNVWVELGVRLADDVLRSYDERDVGRFVKQYTPQKGMHDGPQYEGDLPHRSGGGRIVDAELPKGVVFSDIRFKNEMSSVKKGGGKLIRLKRETSLGGAAAAHISEREQLEVPDSYFDIVIDNSVGVTLVEFEHEVTVAYESLC